MKLSNNAIKFLMAQYRAIYKNAYFKGIATAVVLTAGLAAGAANANPVTDIVTDNDTVGSGSAELQIVLGNKTPAISTGGVSVTGGTGNYIAGNESGTNAPAATFAKKLSITGGTLLIGASGTAAKKGGVALVFNGEGSTVGTGATLNIKAAALDKKDQGLVDTSVAVKDLSVAGTLSVEASDKGNASLTATALTVDTGAAVTVSGADADHLSTIDADTITINGGTVTLGSGGVFGSVDADGGTALTIAGGTLTSTAATTGAKINATSLNMTGGSIVLGDGKAANDATIKIATGTVTNGTIQVKKDATPTIEFAEIDGKDHTLSITGGKVDAGGTVTIKNGTVKLSGASVYTSVNDAAGGFKVESGALLQADLNAITGLTTGKLADGTAIDTAQASGSITVAKGGTLEVLGQNVQISKFKFGSGGALAETKITSTNTEGDSTLKFDSLVLDAKVESGAKFDVNVANTLTLGSGTFAGLDSNPLKSFNAITAKNIAIGSDTAYNLGDAVTLTSVTKAAEGTVHTANKESFSGDLILAKSSATGTLKINGGDYTHSSGTLTIKEGALSVTNTGAFGGTVDVSRLTVADKMALDLAKAATITVDGKGAELDLTNAKLSKTATTAAAAVTFDATNSGVVRLNGENLTEVLPETGSGAIFKASAGGNIVVENGLTVAKIAGANVTENGFLIDNGTLTVNGQLELTGTGSIDFKKSDGTRKLVASSFNANLGTPAGASATLQSGHFTFLGEIATNAENGLKVSGDGNVNLGKFDEELKKNGTVAYYTSNGGGNITSKLVIDGTNGAVNVNAGAWTAQKDLTVTAGKLTVGQAEADAKLDANGEAIKSALTVKGTLDAAASGVEVAKHGTLTANGLKASGSALSVAGNLEINTEYKSTGTGAFEKTGLSLANDSVNIAAGGTVTLGGDGVLNVLGITKNSVSKQDIVNASTNADINSAMSTDGAFKDAAGSTLVLNLGENAENISFKVDALGELQKRLFGAEAVNGTISIGGAKITGLEPKDGEIKWSDIKTAGAEKVMANYESDTYKEAVLVGGAADTLSGHFGSIKINEKDATSASVNNKVSLNKADANGNLVADANGKTIGIKAEDNTYLKLNAAGKVADVKLGKGGTLDVGAKNGTVSLGDLSAQSGTLINNGNVAIAKSATVGKLTTVEGSSLDIAKNLSVKDLTSKAVLNGSVNVGGDANFAGKAEVLGNTTVAGAFSVKDTLSSGKDSILKVSSGSFTAESGVDAKGSIQVVSGAATFKNETETVTLAGLDNQFNSVTFNGSKVNFLEGQTKAAELKLDGTSQSVNVQAGAVLTADVISVKNTGTVIKAGTFGDKDAKPVVNSSTGYIAAGRLDLNGGTLVADPDFGTSAASVVAVKQLGNGTASDTSGFDGGTVKGGVFALQNSIIAIGTDNIGSVQSTFAQYFDGKGSLKKDDGEVGAAAYVTEAIKISNNGSIIIDSKANDYSGTGSTTNYADKVTSAYSGASLYIGANSVLAVDARSDYNSKAPITFEKSGSDNAVIKVDNKDTSKVLIYADGINALSEIDLFDITGSTGKVALTGADSLRVESMNGLFYYDLLAADIGGSFRMKLNANKAEKAFANISQPVRDSIITYAYGAHNPKALTVSADSDTAEPQDPQKLVGEMYSQFIYNNETGTLNLKGADGKADETKDQTAVNDALVEAGLRDEKTGQETWTTDLYGNVYREADNRLLAHALSTLNGVDAETAARLADFGGVAQAALRAGNTTSDAIAARMGVGVNGTVTFAANGQGSGMWVTPVYKTADSDSFGADSVDYGTDMNLYGVAVGADVSVIENVSAGVMFNVGSGDADGQGLGSNVKNDFDYYGFGAYMGYTMGAASVVADVSWTTVDNSVEGQTGLGTLVASIDSSALSLGVTGKYAMDFGGVNVTPHAGLRFTRIDQDDYAVGNGTDLFAQYSSNSMNVFSVPVGVTVEKEYTFDAWSVKPAFDLTLTGNFGDDETSGTVDWEGISNLSTDIKSEFVDTFTYSTAIGVAAQTGNFGMGLGVNYTGASNVKEFGVNANVRYVF